MRTRLLHPPILAATALWLLLAPGACAAEALETLRGKVVGIGEETGEGELAAVTVRLETVDGEQEVLLGPEAVLEATGFGVEVGDELQARVFVDEGTRVAYAQKVMNRSRKLVIRLRSLRRDPLWDTAGRWQGAPAQVRPDAAEPQRPATRVRRRTQRGSGGD